MSGYQKSEAIRARLLDVAEMLFAARGYFGVSIRDITNAAELRNASVNYHFGSKEQLFMAVVDRRIEPLIDARLTRLNQLKIDSRRPKQTIYGLVEAFAEPMLEFADSEDSGWRNYCVLMAHLAVQKFWSENIVSAKLDAHSKRFVEAIQQTFPDTTPYRVHCSFQFLLSTLLYAVCGNERLDALSDGSFDSSDLVSLRAPLYDFMTGGILNVVRASPSSSASGRKPR